MKGDVWRARRKGYGARTKEELLRAQRKRYGAHEGRGMLHMMEEVHV